MDQSDFWALIEKARADCLEHERWPRGSQIGKALTPHLAQLPLDQIVAFQHLLSQATQRVNTWEICAACYLICGYLSDDGFTDFKAGLVGLGGAAFDRVTAAPDDLADLAVVKAIAAGDASPFTVHGELILYSAADAYESRAGDLTAYWQALESLGTVDQAGGEWSGRFGPADGPEIPVRLPRLYALMGG